MAILSRSLCQRSTNHATKTGPMVVMTVVMRGISSREGNAGIAVGRYGSRFGYLPWKCSWTQSNKGHAHSRYQGRHAFRFRFVRKQTRVHDAWLHGHSCMRKGVRLPNYAGANRW